MSNRILMGKLPDGTYGLRIAKSGQDASVNPPVPKNLIFDSAWPELLPIHVAGVVSLPQGTTNSLVKFPSALLYLPQCSIFLEPIGRNGQYAWAYPNLPTDGGVNIIYTGYAGNGSFCQVYVGKSGIGSVYQKVSGDSGNPGRWNLHYVIYKTGN